MLFVSYLTHINHSLFFQVYSIFMVSLPSLFVCSFPLLSFFGPFFWGGSSITTTAERFNLMVVLSLFYSLTTHIHMHAIKEQFVIVIG